MLRGIQYHFTTSNVAVRHVESVGDQESSRYPHRHPHLRRRWDLWVWAPDFCCDHVYPSCVCCVDSGVSSL